MIFNQQELFSDAQAITVAALSTNVIDLGLPATPYGAVAPLNRDIGKGNEIPILVQVVDDFVAGAGMTDLTISIEVGATAALGTVVLSQTIPVASLIAGKKTSFVYLPNDIVGQYLGLRYTPVGGSATAGSITAGITMGVQTNITGP